MLGLANAYGDNNRNKTALADPNVGLRRQLRHWKHTMESNWPTTALRAAHMHSLC